MNERILVVEDDWLTLQMLKMRLKKRSYDVITARNEKEFWKYAFDPQLALIILDVCLKNRLGTDVYRSLLDFGMNRSVPVIFTTGLIHDKPDSQDVKIFGENAKVFGEEGYTFMEKPIDFEQLHREIKRLLQLRVMKSEENRKRTGGDEDEKILLESLSRDWMHDN